VSQAQNGRFQSHDWQERGGNEWLREGRKREQTKSQRRYEERWFHEGKLQRWIEGATGEGRRVKNDQGDGWRGKGVGVHHVVGLTHKTEQMLEQVYKLLPLILKDLMFELQYQYVEVNHINILPNVLVHTCPKKTQKIRPEE
jgi:hypothetical protein